jgi:long-chain acyl-CoA synthetase
VLLHSALYAEKAEEIGKLVPGLRVGGLGTRRSERFLDHAHKALALGDASVFDRDTVASDRVSMMIFTSGTTSEPRGAELTTRGIEVFVESWTKAVAIPPGSRSLMLLPLHHIFGLSTTYFMLASGVPLGICPDFHRLYDAVERFRANCLFLVPALAGLLAKKIGRRGESAVEALGTPIDWIVVGGAPLARLDWERLNALGITVLGGYGLTETTALFSIASSEGPVLPGCAGRVADHPEVGTKVSALGELMTRGPHVFVRYHDLPEETAAAKDADGWFHTGDFGRIDADGNVWVTGRASRTIVLSSGKKVAPEELEARLLEFPGVLEAVVSGDGETRTIRAEIYGSVPEALIRRSVAALNLTLPTYMRIGETVVRETPFPRTSSGKIKL